MNFVLSLADYVFDYKISLRFKLFIIRYENGKHGNNIMFVRDTRISQTLFSIYFIKKKKKHKIFTYKYNQFLALKKLKKAKEFSQIF